jgi:hypothetical protein
LELEFEELLELEFDELLELEFDELLPANWSSFSVGVCSVPKTTGAICGRRMLRMPPASTLSGEIAAFAAPAPVKVASEKASAVPIL